MVLITNLSEKTHLLPPKIAQDSLNNNICIKRRLGLLNGVTMIIGAIVGTGIFVSPKGVLKEVGSMGMALVVWSVTGILSMMGALCYIELGTTFPKSGCDFTYMQMCFGELPAFLFLWVFMLIIAPVGNAIAALTFANYVLEPFFPCSAIPQDVVRVIAALVLCLLTYINCRNVGWATRVQDVFTFAKVLALIVIILAGAYHMFMGRSQNFDNAFQGTTTEPGYIALSFYSGLFSYAGWNFLNFVTEELKDPFRNLPRAIYISLPMVTIIYVLANVAYFAVLSPDEILASNAVAVTFGERVLGVMSWVMPFSVALSTFGGLNGNIFASARLFFVGAREGHLPNFLSMINLNYLTPAPSLVFLCILSLAYLSTTEVYVLINYTAFVEALFVTLSVAGMVWLRYTKPDLERPIKVNIFLPITFLVVCAFLVTFPFYVSPWETGMGIAITLTGIPVYLVTIYWQDKPRFYKTAIGKVTEIVQKLLLSVPEEKYD
ncbi:large neutral amino acids transporter small subunit 2-like isoform X1 [Stegodyphus dumicola]|uniref:large neutral amino acids transporter small subunit 2-like isoform X1 n=1 Tax=Stegodyphus dumicola TaxID=202533 RepID=UPI0015B191DA|nr:large neutral amino acids transporter small subunit 2-like isoform X1 [Stegodyphus dumicola]XP_035211133.1 large neutral amino acids transporter small subunit 2-like isoform X1 [Stegodyphus dumicola]